MGVRVRLKLVSRKAEVVTSALVNSGFESDEPELILPPSLAELLGLEAIGVAQYNVAGGGGVAGLRLGVLKVQLVLEDREGPETDAVATVLPGETEVLISDRLASELGIVILDAYKGLWCLRDELGKRVRESAKPQYWR